MNPEFRAFIKTFHEETIRLFGPRIPESPRQEFIRETQRLNSLHSAYCFLELGTSYYFKETSPPGEGSQGGVPGLRMGDYRGGAGGGQGGRLATLEEDLADLRKLVKGKQVIVRNLIVPTLPKKEKKFTAYEPEELHEKREV